MEILFITIVVLAAALFFIAAAYYCSRAVMASPRMQVRRRLGSMSGRQAGEEQARSILKEERVSEIPLLDRVLTKYGAVFSLERLLLQADVKMRPSVLLLLAGVLAAGGFLLGGVAGRGTVFALVIGGVLGYLPFSLLIRRRRQRVRKFTEQFPDTLDMITRSLRAGHSFTSAMQIVYQEMPDPISKEFRIAFEEQNLGRSLSDALANMAARVNTIDLSFFVTTVNIQRETGGNLAEILEKLGLTIRERFKIQGQIRVYTAQGRISGYILAVLPLAVAMVIWMINPAYLSLLVKRQVGHYMVGTALVMQIIGFFFIKKIINIKI